MPFNSFAQLWDWLSAYDILGILAALTVISAFFEHVFHVRFVGRAVFGLIGRVLYFFLDWAATPFKPTYRLIHQYVHHAAHLEDRLDKMVQETVLREERQSARFDNQDKILADLTRGMDIVKSEVTLNGGGSIKDAVNRLVIQDERRFKMLTVIQDNVRLNTLRLDISDEADKRMTFRLSPKGDLVEVSPVFLRFFGYAESDLLGSDWDFCIGRRSLLDVRDKWARAIDKKQHYRNDQFIVDSDGGEHYCRVEGYPMIEDGELQYFHGTVVALDQPSIA